jgi:uncharacterized protein YbaR (Trm112 family)
MKPPAGNDGTEKPGGLDEMLGYLACPLTGSRLRRDGDFLVSEEGGVRYPIENGIPILLRERAVLPPGVASIEGFSRTFKP